MANGGADLPSKTYLAWRIKKRARKSYRKKAQSPHDRPTGSRGAHKAARGALVWTARGALVWTVRGASVWTGAVTRSGAPALGVPFYPARDQLARRTTCLPNFSGH